MYSWNADQKIKTRGTCEQRDPRLLPVFTVHDPASHRQLAGPLYPSGAPIPDRDLAVLHDDRNIPFSLGDAQHLVKPRLVRFHVIVFGFCPIGFTSLFRIGSAALPVDDDLLWHGSSSI